MDMAIPREVTSNTYLFSAMCVFAIHIKLALLEICLWGGRNLDFVLILVTKASSGRALHNDGRDEEKQHIPCKGGSLTFSFLLTKELIDHVGNI